jgi:hypothetical protein
MSQVQSLKPKHYKNVMNTPTNSVEMIPSMLRMQRKKNVIIWTPGQQDMTKIVNEHWAESPSRTLSRIFGQSLVGLDKVW